MINKNFLSPDKALVLKELGFVELCLAYYQKSAVISSKQVLPLQICTKVENFNDSIFSTQGVPFWSAPLYQQAFAWFREKYHFYHVITLADLGKFEQGIPDFQCCIYADQPVRPIIVPNCNTYLEAEETCILMLIELAKKEKQ